MTDPGRAQEAVLEVVRDLLDDDSLGPADDFYLAGGHSLLIVQLQRRLRRDHGLHLDPRELARNSQLAALAAACRPVAGDEG